MTVRFRGFVKLFVPYGLMVSWVRETYGRKIDEPLFYFPGKLRCVGRMVKFALPYGLVRVFHRRQSLSGRSAVVDLMADYRKPDVLFFGAVEWGVVPQGASGPLVEHLCVTGHRVFYFNPHFSLGEEPIVRKVRDHLYQITFCLDAFHDLFGQPMEAAEVQVIRQVEEVLEKYGIVDSWVMSAFVNWLPVVRHLRHSHSMTSVLDCHDGWDAANGAAVPEFGQMARDCLAEADLVLVDSEHPALKAEEMNDRVYRWRGDAENAVRAIAGGVPRFSIVVLVYGQLEYTKLCLNSIVKWTAYPNYELIVVDNASPDGVMASYLKSFEASHENVRVILNDSNLGFAAGNNVGLKAATGDFLVLLNNDTIVSRGWLSRTLAHFRAHADCGVVGMVSNSVGCDQMVKVHYRTLPGFAAEANARSFNHAFEALPAAGFLAMFAYAFRRDVLDRVGYLPEEYGRGMFEDDDYCWSILGAGYSLLIANDVLIHHFLSVSFDALGEKRKQEQMARNRVVFETKWGREYVPHRYRPQVHWSANAETTRAFPSMVAEGSRWL